MKKILILLAIVPLLGFGQAVEKKGVVWYSFTEAIAKAKANPRPLIIDMFTDWCGWCKRMDAQTFGDTAIASYQCSLLRSEIQCRNNGCNQLSRYGVDKRE